MLHPTLIVSMEISCGSDVVCFCRWQVCQRLISGINATANKWSWFDNTIYQELRTSIFSGFCMSLLNDCFDIFLLSFVVSTNKGKSVLRISYITYQPVSETNILGLDEQFKIGQVVARAHLFIIYRWHFFNVSFQNSSSSWLCQHLGWLLLLFLFTAARYSCIVFLDDTFSPKIHHHQCTHDSLSVFDFRKKSSYHWFGHHDESRLIIVADNSCSMLYFKNTVWLIVMFVTFSCQRLLLAPCIFLKKFLIAALSCHHAEDSLSQYFME